MAGVLSEMNVEPDLQELDRAYALLKHDPTVAIAKLKSLAARGSVSGMLHIGQAYRRGAGVEKDLGEAKKWFQMAAEQASLVGFFLLALTCFARHEDREGLDAVEAAVARRYIPAISLLGQLYVEGRAVPQNLEKGEILLRRAAVAGNIYAKGKWARLLVRKTGLANKLKGVILFLEALMELIVEYVTVGPTSGRLK